MNKRISLVSLALMLLLTLAACGPAATPTTIPQVTLIPPPTPTIAPPAPTIAPTIAPSAFPVTLTDGAGRSVTIAKPPVKIVSLAPSNTEMLFAIGQGSKLVAVDMFSDYPAEVKAIPNVGGSRGAFNYEQLVALQPDLIVAASITGPDALKKLDELKLPYIVVGSRQTTIEGVMGDIALVGKALGASDKAKATTDAMQKKLDALKAKAAGAKSKPKVYWELDGTDPSKPFSVGPGNFVNDLIVLAGGENIFATAPSPFPKVSAEQIVAANPDVIVLSDFAYGVTVESVKARKGWDVIAAVKNNKIFPIDDNLVSRPAPRVVDGLEAALKLIHPELFQ